MLKCYNVSHGSVCFSPFISVHLSHIQLQNEKAIMFSHVTFQNSKEKWVAYLETIYSCPIIFLFTSILCMVCILVTAWLKKTTNGAACNSFPSKCDSLDLRSPRFIRLLSVMTTCCHSISRTLCFEKGLIGADEPAGSPSYSSNEKSLSPRFFRYAET